MTRVAPENIIPRERRAAILVVLGFLLLAPPVFFFTKPVLSQVEHLAAECRPMENPGSARVMALKDAYLVRVDVQANCAVQNTDFEVKHFGSVLVVRSVNSVPEMQTGCLCTRTHDLKIRGLRPANYSVWHYSWP